MKSKLQLMFVSGALLLAGATAWATPPSGSTHLTGSIGTTLADGTNVNANKYTSKTAVYLNGGPQNGTSGSGLPAGNYYFQVTDPSGSTLLSADSIDCRIAVVDSNNRFAGHGTAGPNCTAPQAIHISGGTDPQSGSTPVQLCPAAAGNGSASDPNNWCGTSSNGEYKVWVTPVSAYDPVNCASRFGFCSDTTKTDNFRIDPKSSSTPPATIVWPLGGYKFYDANANGVWDGTIVNGVFVPSPNEPVIDGWQVRAVKSCQEDQAILSSLLGGAILPVNDADFTTPPPTPYGRQFQFTAPGTYETEAFQDPNAPKTFTTDGFYQYKDLNAGGHYSVCEIIPHGAASLFPAGTSSLSGHPKWFATSSTESSDHFLPDNNASFGNVCTGAGGGLTLGFWSNTNGESVMAYGPSFTNKVPKSCNATADNSTGMKATLAFLSTFNLVDANGYKINPTTMGYCNFRKWLLGATATNSAYMLSAQLASMELNVHFGYVNPNALIYAPGANAANTAGFATLSDVMIEANDSLGTNPYVVAHDLLNNNVTLKTYQLALKDALDNANNNLGFVQPDPSKCAISYLDESVNSCIPHDAPAGTTNIWQPIPQNTGGGTGCAVNELINQLSAPPQP